MPENLAKDEIAIRIEALDTKIAYNRRSAEKLRAEAVEMDESAEWQTRLRDDYKALLG